MNPYITVIMVTAGLILLFIIWIVYEERKRRKRLLKKIRRTYGKPSERHYEPGDIENISHYFRRKCGEGFYIDDITWNDLDMDHLYQMVNQHILSGRGCAVCHDAYASF